MNKEFSWSDDLLKYILQQLEFDPGSPFRESRLIHISKSSFQKLKDQKYFQYRQYDPEKEPYFSDIPGDQDVERYVRQEGKKFIARPVEQNGYGPITLKPEDIRQYYFNFNKIIDFIRKINDLTMDINQFSDRLYFIGEKSLLNDRIGVFFGLFGDEDTAGSELSKMKVRASAYSKYLVLSPSFSISAQELNTSLQMQGIFCLPFNQGFEDQSWQIAFERVAQTPRIVLSKVLSQRQEQDIAKHGYLSQDRIEFMNIKKGNRSYLVKINSAEIAFAFTELVILLYLSLELKKGTGGWVNRDILVDQDVITDSTASLDRLVGEIRKKVSPYLEKKNSSEFIENDHSGNWRISTHQDFITHQEANNKNWLTEKYNEILGAVKQERQKRQERDYNFETLKKQQKRRQNSVARQKG